MQAATNSLTKSQIKYPTKDVQTKKQEPQYATDEDELIRETEWVTKENKKRKKNTSPETSPQQQQQKQQSQQLQNKASKKTKKMPPIVLSQIKDYGHLQKQLEAERFTYKAVNMNNEQIKINVNAKRNDGVLEP